MDQEKKAKTKGLTAVFTGDGKGKTTAALGLMLRAAGHKKKICVIQFIKGNSTCGEHEAVKHFDNIEFNTMGRGFTWKSDNIEEDISLAKKAWDYAKEVIESNRYDMVILDELTYLVHYNMIDESELIQTIHTKPENLHLIITGRHATKQVLDVADLVTEMKEHKHHFKNGIKAQKGFEF